jgi:hypothetical protein
MEVCDISAYSYMVLSTTSITQMFILVTDRQTLSSFCNVLCFAMFTWHTLTCDSISTSSWPGLITKCTLNFVVSATARSTTGTGFLDLQVGLLEVIPDFH